MGTRTETYTYCDACGKETTEIVARLLFSNEWVMKTSTHELCPICRDVVKKFWQETFGKSLYDQP